MNQSARLSGRSTTQCGIPRSDVPTRLAGPRVADRTRSAKRRPVYRARHISMIVACVRGQLEQSELVGHAALQARKLAAEVQQDVALRHALAA